MKQETFPRTGCCSDKRILQHLKNTKDPINNQDFKKDEYKLYAWNKTYFWGCKSYSSQQKYSYSDLQYFIPTTMRKEYSNYYCDQNQNEINSKNVSKVGILAQTVKMAQEIVQQLGPEAALMLAQAIAQGAPEGAPQGQPVYARKGAKLVYAADKQHTFTF